MALKPLFTTRHPVGVFDCLDGYTTSFKGGEVVTLTSVANSGVGADKAAYDAFDGYALPSSVQKRPVVTRALASGKRPLFLADEGIAGYGTLLGSVVGSTVGQVTNGTVLGPHTAEASGKVTCWQDTGLYAVTLDAVDTNASTGLQPTNTTLDVGAPLYASVTGVLTPVSANSFEANLVVARFIEFTTNGSLVTTPAKLTTALNSPSGSAAVAGSFSQVVIQFCPNT